MALIATAASSVMADSTVIWRSKRDSQKSELRGSSTKNKAGHKRKGGKSYQDLFSTVIFLLNLFAEVSLRQTKVLSHLPTVLEQ